MVKSCGRKSEGMKIVDAVVRMRVGVDGGERVTDSVVAMSKNGCGVGLSRTRSQLSC